MQQTESWHWSEGGGAFSPGTEDQVVEVPAVVSQVHHSSFRTILNISATLVHDGARAEHRGQVAS